MIVVLLWELVIALMNVFVYYKWQTILLDNVAATIFKKIINLFYQEHDKLPQYGPESLS